LATEPKVLNSGLQWHGLQLNFKFN